MLLCPTAALAQISDLMTVDLGTNDVSNGVTLTNPGIAVPAIVGGVDCRLSSSSLDFDVDDTWAFDGERRNLFVTVEYFDQGTDALTLVYDSMDGVAAKAGVTIERTNTNDWLRFTWHLGEAKFANSQPGGADFRIEVPTGSSVHVNRVIVAHRRGVSVAMDNSPTPPTAEGLTYRNPIGGQAENAWDSVLEGRTNLAQATNAYFAFDVANDFAFEGSRKDLHVTIEYLDDAPPAGATGEVWLDYDSFDAQAADERYKQRAGFTRTGSGLWKTHRWYVKDAFFGDRQNLGCDFRIGVKPTDQLTLRNVTVYHGSSVVSDPEGLVPDPDRLGIGYGLTPVQVGGNTAFAHVQQGQLMGIQNSANANYIHYRVDDTFAHEGSRQDIYLTIHYFDGTSGSIRLEYDSMSGGNYKAAPAVQRQGSGTWKSHSWHLTDARFANGQAPNTLKADFRLVGIDATGGPDPITVDLVYLRDLDRELQRNGILPRISRPDGGSDVAFDATAIKDLMTQPSQWVTARSRIGVMQWTATIVQDLILPYPQTFDMRSMLRDLQTWGKMLEIEAIVVKPHFPNLVTAQQNFDFRRPTYDKILAFGGTLDQFRTQEPADEVRNVNQILGVSPPLFDPLSEAVDWIQLARNRYPGSRVGDVEPYPRHFSRQDLESWIVDVNDLCASRAVLGLDFFDLDVNWSMFTGEEFEVNPVWNNGSFADSTVLGQSCQSLGVPFGMNYWPAGARAAAGLGAPFTDEHWYDLIHYQRDVYAAAGLEPDRRCVQSWVPSPMSTIPETTPFTFANGISSFFLNF
ncbi:MAG: hypothetical protein KDE27_12740 [Planctomycetes bacterium]|nr:hypothetical protein [Planctomycetota bacterium]